MRRPLLSLVGFVLLAPPAAAQVGLASSAQTVVLTATKHGSVRVALPGGSSATLPGSLGVGANDFAPVAIETTWDLDPSSASAVTLVAYFQTPAAALAGPGVAIPSSAVLARMPGAGTGFVPFTGAPLSADVATAGTAGGTVVLFSQPVAGDGASGRRTDRLEMRIDLTGWTTLPPGQYRGTLSLLAITQ